MAWFKRTPEPETRADTFAEKLLEQRLQEAQASVTSNALGAVEACAALYGRAVGGFRIEDADGWTIRQHELEAVGRSIFLDGQAMLLRTGGVSSSWTVYGQSPDPDRWYFDVTVSSPSGTRTVRRRAAQVALLRINPTAAQPWRGQSPLVGSATTLGLGKRLEDCLTAEHNAAVGAILAVPSGTPQQQLDRLRDDLKTLGGRTALVESTRGGWGDGRQGQPQRDWQQQRIGPEPPPALQLASIASMISRASTFWAASAGARSTPAHNTCGLAAESSVRTDSQQYRRLSSCDRSTEISADGFVDRVLSMRNTAQCWHGSEIVDMFPQGSGMPLPR